jgi:hypothetical protein
MRKFFIMSSFLMATLFSFQTKAQSLVCGITMGSPSGVQINYVNLNVVSTQAAPPPTGQQTWTNNLSGTYNITGGTGQQLLGPLYYWSSPTAFSAVNFNIASTNYAVIQNTSATKLIVWITVSAANQSGASVGTQVVIPWNQTATVYFPTSGGHFTADSQFGPVDPYNLGYPVTMPIQIDVQAAPTN